MNRKKLSIVVPTFNEAKNIFSLLQQLEDALKGVLYEVVFIDDSNDHTPEILEQATSTYPNVRYEHRTTEKGLATAVLRGFVLAEGDYIAVMDADLQHPPSVLRAMYCCMGSGTDVCIPSRFIPGGSDGGLNFYRKFISWSARYLGKCLLKSLRKVTDPTSGLFMFKKEIIEGADLQPIGWKIMVEVLAMGHFSTITELPYGFQARNAGESKLSGKVTLQYVKQLLTLMKRAQKNQIRVTKWSPEKLDAAMKEFNAGIQE